MGILAYQLGIFIAIQIASIFGKSSRNTAIFLISIFTVLQVYTESLMILQFATIIISYFISKSIFFSKKEKETVPKSSNKKPEIKEEFSYKKTVANEFNKKKTKGITDYNDIRKKFLENIGKEVSKDKQSLIEHLEHNFKDFKEELKKEGKKDLLNSYQNVINRFERTINSFEKKTQKLYGAMNFENYIFLHKMILKKLIIAKHEYETKNKIIDLYLFMENICLEYSDKKRTYKLDITDYRQL